jgi:hypothetical protein
MTITGYKLVDFLVVEDNPGDALLTNGISKSNNIYNTLYIVKDGAQAIDFLRRKVKFADALPARSHLS